MRFSRNDQKELKNFVGQYVYRVVIIESERGWGQRVDDVFYFTEADEAEKWVTQYNAVNALPEVPDWYMYAEKPVRTKLAVG